MKTRICAGAIAAATALASAADVTPGVIFGSGNANGGFTVATGAGIELGLRAKVRYDANGQPKNQFNQVGNTNTYVFDPSAGNAPAGRATWNWEWSVNSNVDGTGGNLSDFIYEIAIYKDGTDPSLAARADLINNPIAMLAFDHAFGDNTTTAANNEVGSILNYADMIANFNVAQNSSNFGFLSFFFGGTSMSDWEAGDAGTYIITLTAFENLQGVRGDELVSTNINVVVVPLPPAAWAGLGLLGTIAGVRAVRRRR
jgi:hypothetical protein